jgi:hypothetical protein
MAKSHTPPTVGVAASRRKRSDAENRRGNPKIQQDGFSPQNMLHRIIPSRQCYAPTRSNSSPRPARLQCQVPPQGRIRGYCSLRKRSKQHPLRSLLTHTRERRGLQSPRRMTGQTDIMTRVSQSRFHLIACNLWTTCTKWFP